MDQAASHARARQARVNPVIYWVARVLLQVALRLYFRASRLGQEQIPASGPAILASNHRSFLDPFVIGTMSRRPIYYLAKSELFRNPVLAWSISALGAFPVERGAGDRDAIRTARELLARGELVLIFPEGTRTRPGPLGRPKRGVGRLALESGAPIVPVAIIGTEDVRRGILIRPRRVRVIAGTPIEPLAWQPSSPEVRVIAGSPIEPAGRQPSSPELAEAVTTQAWASVSALWESLGGAPAVQDRVHSQLASVA